MNEFFQYYRRVVDFFRGDEGKAALWWDTKNPQLADLSPREMLARGRDQKLYQWIDHALQENERSPH